jgi:hypothetical protein
MVADLRNAFRVLFIMSEAPLPIPSASERVRDVQSRPVWDGASISPATAEYPRVHLAEKQAWERVNPPKR